MKFGKEFRVQMVPEWQAAYMDYNLLKIILKDVRRMRHVTIPSIVATSSERPTRNMTLYRAFSGLLADRNNIYDRRGPTPAGAEGQTIFINPVNRNGSRGHVTTFLGPTEQGGEYELVYFRRLDDEFIKVDKFYRSKVKEMLEEAALLDKQMDVLIPFRIKVEKPVGLYDGSSSSIPNRTVEITSLASDVAASAVVLASSTAAETRTSSRKMHLLNVIVEGLRRYEQEQSDESNFHCNNENVLVNEGSDNHCSRSRPAPLDILSRIKVNNLLETPRSTIKGVFNDPKQKELKFTRENLRKVENQLKLAFVEFYQKLCILKSFAFLNTLAFSKIMKKYDKISSRNASKSYMKMVDNSYLGCSDEIAKLMERVEVTFIKHFSNSNRGKGMSMLRPRTKREKHRTTFSLGLLFGCSIALIAAVILIVHVRNIMNLPGRLQYMENMFPLYSLFAFIVLHMLMYAADIYFWKRYHVNDSFIFGFKQGTKLSFRQVLVLSLGLAVLSLSSVLSNLDMEMDPHTKDYKQLTELIPLILVILMVIMLALPFNILYRPTRFFFLTCLFHCIAAPLYKVTLPDFFLADQLTSQVQAIRSLEFYVCYYGWGDYKHRRNTCKTNDVYNTFYFIVAVVPYWARLLQCLRRLFEEKDTMQGWNGMKYFLTIVAICMRTAYSLNQNTGWRIVAWFFSAIAAIMCTYWDLVFDWGLLQPHSQNRWLRDKLLVTNKQVYYGAMVLNVLLRFAWLQTVLDFQLTFLHKETMTAIVAILEIFRRGIWNFFRLENEHLNNVGKYRAFKSIPLPFNYDEDDYEDV